MQILHEMYDKRKLTYHPVNLKCRNTNCVTDLYESLLKESDNVVERRQFCKKTLRYVSANNKGGGATENQFVGFF